MNIESLDLLREALPYIQRFKGKTFVHRLVELTDHAVTLSGCGD